MELKLICIGTGDAFGSGGRLQPCFIVQGTPDSTGLAGGVSIALDFGLSSLIGLRAQDIEPNSIDTIVLSHLHGDHCGGVPFLLMDAMLGSRRTSPLTVIGPEGTENHINKLQEDLFPGSHVMVPKFDLSYHELQPMDEITFKNFSISAIAARHTVATKPLTVKLVIGKKIVAYTGDGEVTDELVDFVEASDLLITECYFYDKHVKWHANYPDIKRLSAKKKVLTHMHSSMLSMVDKIPEVCAYDGMTVAF